MATLSIIIPMYDEKDTFEKLLSKVEDVDLGRLRKEIIIIDDCSKDGTREMLKKYESKYRVLYHRKNGGKGKAIRTGLKYAKGDILVIQDADLEYEPGDFKDLVQPILKNETKVVYGSRFLKKGNDGKAVGGHEFGNKMLSLITSILYFRKVTDMETCYKMFRKEVLHRIGRLRATRFDFEPEMTAKIIKAGYKIKEMPIHYYPRDFSEGKKINWKDGVKALLYLLRYRFLD